MGIIDDEDIFVVVKGAKGREVVGAHQHDRVIGYQELGMHLGGVAVGVFNHEDVDASGLERFVGSRLGIVSLHLVEDDDGVHAAVLGGDKSIDGARGIELKHADCQAGLGVVDDAIQAIAEAVFGSHPSADFFAVGVGNAFDVAGIDDFVEFEQVARSEVFAVDDHQVLIAYVEGCVGIVGRAREYLLPIDDGELVVHGGIGRVGVLYKRDFDAEFHQVFAHGVVGFVLLLFIQDDVNVDAGLELLFQQATNLCEAHVKEGNTQLRLGFFQCIQHDGLQVVVWRKVDRGFQIGLMPVDHTGVDFIGSDCAAVLLSGGATVAIAKTQNGVLPVGGHSVVEGLFVEFDAGAGDFFGPRSAGGIVHLIDDIAAGRFENDAVGAVGQKEVFAVDVVAGDATVAGHFTVAGEDCIDAGIDRQAANGVLVAAVVAQNITVKNGGLVAGIVDLDPLAVFVLADGGVVVDFVDDQIEIGAGACAAAAACRGPRAAAAAGCRGGRAVAAAGVAACGVGPAAALAVVL